MVRDHLALAAAYQQGVLDGSIPACKWVRLACERNRSDLDRQGTAEFPYAFDPAAARRICQFAELLPHIKGPKAVTVGEDDSGRALWSTIVLEPWQCWFLTTLFGWLRPGGLRRFRVALMLVPRKNAKSTIGAIIALYVFAVEGVSGAECYSAATTRDQAKIVAEIAWEMASRSPQFREQFGVRLGSRTTRSLVIRSTAAKFGPLSADAQSLDGLNVLLAIIDELHAHRTRAVWDVLDTATGAQLQPLLVALTTAGVEIGGICHEKLGYLEKILDGVAADDSFFGINYTIDPGDEHHLDDEGVQRKANPNWGVSVQPDDLARKVREAQQNQGALNNVLTKHFNVWIRSESAWMGASLWQGRAVGDLTVESMAGVPCWIGVDLGETRDPSALALVFRDQDGTYTLIPRIYMPADTVANAPIAQLAGWVRQGWIIETPGNEADYARIESDVLSLFALLTVREIDFDRRSARLMMQNIRRALESSVGRERAEQVVLDIPQSTEVMDPAMKLTEALVLGGRLRHDGNPVMAWMVSNIVVERNHKGEIYPRKSGGKDSWNKIDGAIAWFTAFHRAVQGTDPETSVYETRGLATI